MAYKPGDYLVICDICGFRKYASECRLNWKKQLVCSDTCFEEKHEQYTDPRPLHEKQRVLIHRPPGEDIFITTPVTPDDL